MLYIVGLGPGDPDQLTLGALKVLEAGYPVFLRTAVHPVVPFLEQRGIKMESFDALYESKAAFEDVYKAIVASVMRLASQNTDVVYAVPGNPLFGEATVTGLMAACQKQKMAYHMTGGVSFIDVAMDELGIDAVEGLKIIDAYEIKTQKPDKNCANIITQVHSRHIASEVKLALADAYGDETQVTLIINGGIPGKQQIIELPLYAIDRESGINHLTSLYIPKQPGDMRDGDKLIDIMETLRAPGGCPWDREQTHETLKPYLLEETYEVIDAIETGDIDNLIEELGDLLFQIVFHAELGREDGLFSLYDVFEGINKKMVSRHPHVFAEVQAETPEAVVTNWEAIKQKEKHTQTISDEMNRIPRAFTALMAAYKIQAKASKTGFDWQDPRPALDKVFEEAGEVAQELSGQDAKALEEELGDLLFAVVNVVRLAGYQPELVLDKGNAKFKKRFATMESLAGREGVQLSGCTLEQQENDWQKAKKA